MMNVEMISVLVAVVAVGISLAGLMLASWRGIRREIRDVRQETREEFHTMRQETREEFHTMRQEMRDLRSHMSRVDSHIGELRERVGHVEGLLKGLRDAFVRRTASD